MRYNGTNVLFLVTSYLSFLSQFLACFLQSSSAFRAHRWCCFSVRSEITPCRTHIEGLPASSFAASTRNFATISAIDEDTFTVFCYSKHYFMPLMLVWDLHHAIYNKTCYSHPNHTALQAIFTTRVPNITGLSLSHQYALKSLLRRHRNPESQCTTHIPGMVFKIYVITFIKLFGVYRISSVHWRAFHSQPVPFMSLNLTEHLKWHPQNTNPRDYWIEVLESLRYGWCWCGTKFSCR